jgi:predicted nucleotidyltransferase
MVATDTAPIQNLVHRLVDLFAALPQIEAVALGGSQVDGTPDPASDIDLYVYTRTEIPLAERRDIVEKSGGARRADLGLTYWGPGDEWFDALTGIEVDVVYFEAAWMESQIQRVVWEHQPSLGYSTCFWHTVRHSQVLHDPRGWFQKLQAECQVDYPEPLRQNIIRLNHAVLRGVIPAYAYQLEKAITRGDLVSINHRLAALLSSYFDILFALNRVLHPGEKRLVPFMLANCPRLPLEAAADIQAVLGAGGIGAPRLLGDVARLLDRLDELLVSEGVEIHRRVAEKAEITDGKI